MAKWGEEGTGLSWGLELQADKLKLKTLKKLHYQASNLSAQSTFVKCDDC